MAPLDLLQVLSLPPLGLPPRSSLRAAAGTAAERPEPRKGGGRAKGGRGQRGERAAEERSSPERRTVKPRPGQLQGVVTKWNARSGRGAIDFGSGIVAVVLRKNIRSGHQLKKGQGYGTITFSEGRQRDVFVHKSAVAKDMPRAPRSGDRLFPGQAVLAEIMQLDDGKLQVVSVELDMSHPGNVKLQAMQMQSFGRSGDWEKALASELCRRLNGLRPNMMICSASINVCEKHGRWQQAAAFLEGMRFGRLETDVVTHTLSMMGMQRVTEWQKALFSFYGLSGAGMAPDSHTFGVALGACKRFRGWSHALELHQGAMSAGVEPDLLHFNRVLGGCQTDRRWKHASLLVEKLSRLGVQMDVVSCNCMLFSCHFHDPARLSGDPSLTRLARPPAWRQSVGFLSSSLASRLHLPNTAYDPVFYAMEKSSGGFGALSLPVCGEELEPAGELDLHADEGDGAQGSRSLWQHAFELLHSMQLASVAPTFESVRSMLSMIAQSKDWEKTLWFLRTMERSRLESNSGSYALAIRSCTGSQRDGVEPNVPQALALLSEISARRVALEVQSCGAAIIACGAADEWEQALWLFRGEFARHCPEEVLHQEYYGHLVRACRAGGAWTIALALLQEMQDLAMQPDQFAYTEMLHLNAMRETAADHAESGSTHQVPGAGPLSIFDEHGRVPALPVHNSDRNG